MKSSRKQPQKMKAFNILHLEHVANRIDQLLNPTQREQFTQVRQIKPGIKFVINNKLTPYKHRQSVFEQIQSSRSSIIQTQDRQRKSNNSSSKSSSFLEKKINQLKKELGDLQKARLFEKNKPIHSVHKMALYNNLQEIQQDHKLLIIDKKPQSARKIVDKSLEELNGPFKKKPQQHMFLQNLAIENSSNQLEPSVICIPSPEIKAKIKVIPSQQRSVSQGLITQQKRPIKIWNNDLIEFKGWDVEEEDDYLRLG
ncbi:unnamed protein product (macronuclear) [Paramecium tetraurelia]|uniref:Uncharacterized protein n=1 Tax=Paramecium tetraurelia TaxID=5888 RepID=A0CIA2_PARTE|nr:uncharacterized protein GSPATT00007654001 [Paramecium tetraurelia]CAK70519.1 unnamed protein product [Paramecium tetraurelia]|eukprot:XP_001437916.1 hypothetical protein (macronuclear) [Paramecium tetraurelia strain d4-2]